ncbi:Uncharacterized membrane protein [Friedmanniella luteola]|uniref:Uncharacterized membrane protein n=1 Tax=Friedmanniella luteola TaxID=546871 RepID=A0A1H1YBY3_9ACTN|nr:DUF2243 domain-containing protein [Friedmanniella luteola]SDT18912.1 Uncharacterized membrane protein [Friedmanniella luteola]
MSQAVPQTRPTRTPRAASWWSGALVGVGVAAFVDETVFHQLLHWHHFYDRSTPEAGLVSDGLFHAFGWFAVVAGLFWFAALRRRAELVTARWVGGLLVGAGAFQLYDGTVQHKLLGLHQIRYDVDLAPYDLAWDVVAVALVVAGVVVGRRDRRAAAGG